METDRRERTNAFRRDRPFQKRHPNRPRKPAPPRIDRHYPRPRHRHFASSRAPSLAQIIQLKDSAGTGDLSLMTCRSCRIPDSETIMPLPLGVDPRFTGRERQLGLDLLRAPAITVVAIYHAALFGFKLPSRIDRFGWIGVDLFFVLSGYLIGGQLLAPLAREESIKLGRFFARRVFRIMPAYFVILAVYFLLPSWREYPDMAQPLWKFLLSVQNIALHGGTAFSHAWSLAVEDQFYLALPFVLLILFWRPRGAI